MPKDRLKEAAEKRARGQASKKKPPPGPGASANGVHHGPQPEPDTLLPKWPAPLRDEALHGPVGELVRVIGPHTEADPAALLFQGLVAFGNVIGRGPHYRVEADEHHGNEFLVLVGQSGKGRKGTSWGHIRRLFVAVDPDWEDRTTTGLSSGEGLIEQVRDSHGQIPGVTDKRLLVVESEFASVLKVMEREGNRLSPILRLAWEGGTLRSLVKNAPARATGPHISLIGHITGDELRRYLTATESANGLGNRHLFACVGRSKYLPDGGSPSPAELDRVQRMMNDAVGFARQVKVLRRDDEAREVWHAVYRELSDGRPGLSGALTGRAEAHVLRLSLLYALLDQSGVIRREHLLAALACWDYVADSVRFVFGDSLGDPTADEILRCLRNAPEGMTRTEISAIFNNNRPAKHISQALQKLSEFRLAEVRADAQTGGRSAERWFATARRT